jgi:hypothetical protein
MSCWRPALAPRPLADAPPTLPGRAFLQPPRDSPTLPSASKLLSSESSIQGGELPESHYRVWLRGRPIEMRDPQTLKYIEAMHKAFPESRAHREALQAVGSDFTFARQDASSGVWEAAVGFNEGVSRRLGLTRNVLVAYLPFTQVFDKQLLRVRQTSLPGRAIEDHVALVSSKDPQIADKLADWSARNAMQLLPMPRSDKPVAMANVLCQTMHRSLSGRNAYEVTNAVTGDDFFGRDKIINDLRKDLAEGYVAGVFGLRKVGKTSIVKEVIRRYDALSGEDLPIVTLVEDLEHLPDALQSKMPRLCASLAKSLRIEFKRLSLRTHEMARLTGGLERGRPVTPADLRDAIHATLAHSTNQDAVVVLALDEVESLITPKHGEEDAPEVAEFLGVLRSLSQEHENFKVMLAGITSAPFRQGVIYGRENPLFSWAKPVYIGPLLRQEADTMTIRLGRRMATSWHGAALEELHRVTSGHAFLHRNLAGRVVQAHLDQSPEDHAQARQVTANDVLSHSRPWQREASEIVDAMLEALARYYPDGWRALNYLREGHTFEDVDSQEGPAVATLIHLGVLTEASGVLDVSPWARISTLLRRLP